MHCMIRALDIIIYNSMYVCFAHGQNINILEKKLHVFVLLLVPLKIFENIFIEILEILLMLSPKYMYYVHGFGGWCMDSRHDHLYVYMHIWNYTFSIDDDVISEENLNLSSILDSNANDGESVQSNDLKYMQNLV